MFDEQLTVRPIKNGLNTLTLNNAQQAKVDPLKAVGVSKRTKKPTCFISSPVFGGGLSTTNLALSNPGEKHPLIILLTSLLHRQRRFSFRSDKPGGGKEQTGMERRALFELLAARTVSTHRANEQRH